MQRPNGQKQRLSSWAINYIWSIFNLIWCKNTIFSPCEWNFSHFLTLSPLPPIPDARMPQFLPPWFSDLNIFANCRTKSLLLQSRTKSPCFLEIFVSNTFLVARCSNLLWLILPIQGKITGLELKLCPNDEIITSMDGGAEHLEFDLIMRGCP